jgi:hypothetical protein
MKRRTAIIVTAIAALVIALGAIFVLHQTRQRRGLERQALEIASARLNQTLSTAMAHLDINGPHLEARAKLDGDVTTVTFTISNRTPNLYKEIRFHGLTLGKMEPREKAALPVEIAELAPGGSHTFALHYDGLAWIGDDVPVTRIDLLWAEKPLDFSNSWVTVVKSPPSEPGVTVNSSEIKGSSSGGGGGVRLDEADARALKERRDAAWKAKDAKQS